MNFNSDKQRRAMFANMFSIKADNVSRGNRFEQNIHKRLKRSDGVVTMRAMGSRGTWDLVSITPDKVRLIQAKTHGYIEPKERKLMIAELQHMPDNVQAELEYYVSPRVSKNFTIKKAGETDWDKVEERMEHFAKVRGYRKRDSKFSFIKRKNNGWYPEDSNLPDDFPIIVGDIVSEILKKDTSYKNSNDERELTKLTSDVSIELDKIWKPEWGNKPSGNYIREDVRDVWEYLD